MIIIMALALLAASVMAQQSGIEQEAEDRRFEASELLSELNARDWDSQDAMGSLDSANNAFDEGMTFFNNQAWQAAIVSFNDAINLGNDAIAYQDAEDLIDDMDSGIPWGGEIDINDIGQGVRASDFPMLMGMVLISIFIILPVTYYLV